MSTHADGIVDEKIILAKGHDQPIGYIQRVYNGDLNGFGPFGVSKQYRSGGLGSVLLHLCWQAMKDVGLKTAYFKTIDELAKKFYMRNGMVVDQVMYHMNGELKTCR